MLGNYLLEQNLLPDSLIKWKIKGLLGQRLKDENQGSIEKNSMHLKKLCSELSSGPIAEQFQEANEQHYEVPTEFYQKVLGKHLKYSCCLWNKAKSLDEAELEMLEAYTERAELKNGQTILDLGCGWGSLSLFLAKKYPDSKIISVSNSSTQKAYIDSQIEKRELNNLTIITKNINDFQTDTQFDRVLSIEMFEHMRNYKELLSKVSSFLKNDGKLFVHIFVHKDYTYYFDIKDETDWMSRYFFSGGIMPSEHLLYYFNDHLKVEKTWTVSGEHYKKTSYGWLDKMDSNKNEILEIFKNCYGEGQEKKWFSYWRVFFLSCAELWGFEDGNEWYVGHYLLKK